MRKLIHLMALVLFSSCTSIGYQEVSCEQLSASALRALMWQGMQPEQFQAWIGDTFHVSSANIHIDVAESGRRRLFQWQADGIGYRAVIQDGTLTDVSVSYGERRPEAGRFLTCLGMPERYSASYEQMVEGNELGVDLLFAAQGSLAYGAKLTRIEQKQPPPVDERFPITGLRMVRPGTADQVLHEIYGDQPNDVYEKTVSGYRPWPGEWKNIVIDIDPTITK